MNSAVFGAGLVVCLAAAAPASPGATQRSGASVASSAKSSVAPANLCPGQFDLTKLNGLCDFVFDRTRLPLGSTYRFEWDRAISEAACTSPAEPADAQRAKIQRLWNQHQARFRCTSPTFDVSQGSVLKYAISSGSFSFVNTVLARWALDLNHIDPSDGRTILDYTKRQLDVNRGSSNEHQLQEFFNQIRARGGKFASELSNTRGSD